MIVAAIATTELRVEQLLEILIVRDILLAISLMEVVVLKIINFTLTLISGQ